jgi:DNA-binding HxlR family transcriptional regulator
MDADLHPIVPTLQLQCPINSSLRVLGRKWALLVLRDIGFMASFENGGTAGSPKLTPRAVPVNFSQILRGNPGLGPRLLCMRLKELQTEGLIERMTDPRDRRLVKYQLTRKGRDAIPVLTALIQFGAWHYPQLVFNDGKRRSLYELFPNEQEFMLGRLFDYALDGLGSP